MDESERKQPDVETNSAPSESDPKKATYPKDPLRSAPETHPAGVATGAAIGGAAGAAIGAVIGGPIGAVVGTVVGGFAGGEGGKAVAHAINPAAEDSYWRQNWHSRDYADRDLPYDEHWHPAYRHGWEARMMHGDRDWKDVEPELEHTWKERRGRSALDWARARLATRDAWDRLEGRAGPDPDDRRDH
jgi:hypothetical protein